MRHRIAGKKLGRSVGQRNALRRTLMTQFFTHERITTTRAKAEAIQGEAEHLITKAKHGHAADDPAYGIHIRRLLAARLDGQEVVRKVYDVLAPRFAERNGGYTRMLKLGPRKGDAAEMVILELVERTTEEDKGKAAGRGSEAPRRGGLFNRIRRPRQATPPGTPSTAEGGEKAS